MMRFGLEPARSGLPRRGSCRTWTVIALLGALLCTPSIVQASAGVEWFKGTVDDAQAAAKQQDLLLLVDCWATWCTFCRKMDLEVWTNGDLAESVKGRAVPVKAEVDITRDVGTEFGERYEIDGLPVVLLIDPADGRELARLSGYANASSIVETLETAWRASRGAKGAKGAAEDGDASADDPHALLADASREKLLGNTDAALASARRAAAADPLCANDVADDAALLIAGLEREAGRATAAHDALARVAGPCGRADRAAETWSAWAGAAGEAHGPAAAGEIYAQKLALFPNDPQAMLEWAGWAAEHADDPAALDEALALARRVADLDPADPRAPQIEARIHAALGDRDAALGALERAIAIDPHDRELRSLRLRWTLRGVSGRVK